MNTIKIPFQKQLIGKSAFFVAIFVFVIFVFYSDMIKTSVSNSLEICTTVIIPSLFPMLIISRIINEIKIPDIMLKLIKTPMNKIFGLSENCFQAILTGLTGGYPVGIKNAVALYKNKSISLDEAQKLTYFCVSPGFAFAVTLTGTCIFSSIGIGIRIFIANILADLTMAVLLKNKKKPDYHKEERTTQQKSFSVILTDSITDSVSSIMSICAWICFISAISTLLSSFVEFTFIKNLIIIFSEVTNAMIFCAESKNILLGAFCSGFSGFCIIFQLFNDLNFLSVKISYFILSRFFCAIFSALYEWMIICVFPVSIQTASQNVHIRLSKYSAIGSAALLFMCAAFMISTAKEKFKSPYDNKT